MMSHPSLLTHLLPIIIITTSLSSALSSKSVWLIRACSAQARPLPGRVTAVIAFILSKQLSAQIHSQGHIPFNSQYIQQCYTRPNNNSISNSNILIVRRREYYFLTIFNIVDAGQTHCVNTDAVCTTYNHITTK